MATRDGSSTCWAADPSISAKLLDEPNELGALGKALRDAVVVSVDCEWSPNAKSSGPRCVPPALVVQLGIRRQSRRDECWVLDMMALPPTEVARLLSSAFHDERVLKLGYQLPSDLRAIAAATDAADDAPCASVGPAIDLGALSSFLLALGVPGVASPACGGLSALVEAQLGLPMDKTLQCSAWDQRPLSAAQVSYAAQDALVLLSLLDSFLQAVRHDPWTHPLFPAPARLSKEAQVSPRRDFSGATTPGGGDGAEGLVREGAGKDFGGVAEEASTTGPQSAAWHGEAERCERGRAGDPGAEAATAAAWGCELRVEHAKQGWRVTLAEDGPFGVGSAGRPHGVRGSRRGKRVEVEQVPGFSLARAMFGGGGDGRGSTRRAEAVVDVASVVVPWEQGLGGRARFLLDSMLEGLARLMRLYGVDAAGLPPELRDVRTSERWRAHRAMVEAAEREGRVVLTQDRAFVRARYTAQAYLVQQQRREEQMREVAGRFRLPLHRDDIMSRCSKCNGEFEARQLSSAELPAGHEVPDGVLQSQSTFWRCGDCGQIYWEGGKFHEALERLSERIEALGIGQSKGRQALSGS